MATNWRRSFVSLGSATGTRNGAGFHPCQGLYYHPKEKIGIFIDGPKNREGTQLALESLRRSNVVFSACHDIMFQEDNTYCPNLDEEYRKTYSFLNKSINNIILKENCYKGKTIGEYFPKGMGITFFYKDNKGLCVE